MNAIKDKLLKLIGDTKIDEMQISMLVDLLEAKLKKYEDNLQQAQVNVSKLEQRNQALYENYQRELRYSNHPRGEYYFSNGAQKLIVRVIPGKIDLLELKDGVMYSIQPA